MNANRAITVGMAMRTALVLLVVATPAAADTFGGFSGVDRPYLVNQDRVCGPLVVKDGVATGAPACEQAAADVVAKLSIKAPVVQRGLKATFVAKASGKTLTVTSSTGDVVATWDSVDPIGKIVEVYTSQYEDRVAVAYTVRSLGKEVTDVVAFELVKTTGKTDPTAPATTPTTAPPTTTAPPDDPAVTKALAAARKAPSAKAWNAVLAVDAAQSEARYRLAALAAAKQPGAALAALDALAKSPRPDAIEWLVDARFDPAFATLRADAKFRAAVGLDRKPTATYERVMGFGGQFEQTGTCGEKPEVRLVLARDRSFKLAVKMMCEGHGFETAFKGTWRLDGDGIVLTVPTKGQKPSPKDDAPCKLEHAGDEDALHCVVGRDLDFVVLPARR